MFKTRISAALLLLMSSSVLGDETNTLTVDRFVSSQLTLAFPNDKNEQPKSSDFELLNYVLMSNELGERWAVVTLKNSASGSRVLKGEHLLALFADGNRKQPLTFKLNFEADEVQSITVSFGVSKFPILTISSAADIKV